MSPSSTPPRIGSGAGPADQADAAEVVVKARPDSHGDARPLELDLNIVREAPLEVDEVADGVQAGPVYGIAGAQAFVGDIMPAIRSPGSRSPVSRSASPSMLFRWRSSPGSQSPEPSPRLVVKATAFPP